MSTSADFLILLAALAGASVSCRVLGYVLMGAVPMTPRVQAALRAIPLGVMIGIVTPTLMRGHWPELLAILTVGVVMRATGRDLLAVTAGVTLVALARLVPS
jgi:uncharacterized membrane protein